MSLQGPYKVLIRQPPWGHLAQKRILTTSLIPLYRSWFPASLDPWFIECTARGWGSTDPRLPPRTRVRSRRGVLGHPENVAVALVLLVFLNKSCCNQQTGGGYPSSLLVWGRFSRKHGQDCSHSNIFRVPGDHPAGGNMGRRW